VRALTLRFRTLRVIKIAINAMTPPTIGNMVLDTVPLPIPDCTDSIHSPLFSIAQEHGSVLLCTVSRRAPCHDRRHGD
jgi:hypothetical protein